MRVIGWIKIRSKSPSGIGGGGHRNHARLPLHSTEDTLDEQGKGYAGISKFSPAPAKWTEKYGYLPAPIRL
jgi:hypothetical protein